MTRRASLSDRQPKQTPEKGRGVDALFEPATPKPERSRVAGGGMPSKRPAETGTRRGSARTATFNLYSNHQNFLDEFVRKGKEAFRKSNVGVGAINKSAVLQELLDLFQADSELQDKVMASLRQREAKEGSRHDPRQRS